MKKFISVVENLVIIVLVFVLVIGAISKLQSNKDNSLPSIIGLRTFTVLTGSMNPKIKPGDIVVIREVESNSIEVGDVITYYIDNMYVTHRVYEVINKGNEILFKTKGDANNTVDSEAISESQIIGKKLFRIPYGGYVAGFTKRYFILLIFLIIAIISIYKLIDLLKKSKQTKEE